MHNDRIIPSGRVQGKFFNGIQDLQLGLSVSVPRLSRSDQKVILTWDRDPSIIDIVFEPLAQIGNEAVPHFLGKRKESPGVGRS